MPTLNTPETAATILAQMRISYCGCDVRIPELCPNCVECKAKHCKCGECKGCHLKMWKEELCAACGRCPDNCCVCVVCSGCSKREPERLRSAAWCRTCARCPDCCKCYICLDCNRKYEAPNLAKWHQTCGKCEDHCLCFECRYGEDGLIKVHRVSHIKICTTCNRCKGESGHCQCVLCTTCNRTRTSNQFHTVSGLNGEDDIACGKCTSCCRCKVQGIPMRSGNFRLWNSIFGKGEFKGNPLRRHLSVEMEIDQFSKQIFSRTLNEQLDRWGDAVVRDGSIAEGGVEINTNPCNGDLFLNHIREITTGLERLKASCTAACGLHVHVNVKGNPLLDKDGKQMVDQDGHELFDPRTAYNHYDLRRLILLYNKVEPAMYMLCNESRLKGRYSVICGSYYMSKDVSPKDFRKNIVTKMYREGMKIPETKVEAAKQGGFKQLGMNLRKNKTHKYQQVRYKSLNLHSFFLRGTIEFRHKEGSVDFKEITNWALICGTVVDMASKMTEKDIIALSNKPTLALASVLPDNLRSYAQEYWAAKEAKIPRFKQIYGDAFKSNPIYEF